MKWHISIKSVSAMHCLPMNCEVQMEEARSQYYPHLTLQQRTHSRKSVSVADKFDIDGSWSCINMYVAHPTEFVEIVVVEGAPGFSAYEI
jgi:hypothetical protein